MTETQTTKGVAVSHLIQCSPDQLIDLGHRMKQAAMDTALPGDSVLLPLTEKITLVYHPEKEFTKPVHRTGPGFVAVQGENSF